MVRMLMQQFGEAERPASWSTVQGGHETGIKEVALERRGWMLGADFRGKTIPGVTTSGE